jgi:hypothetical protein
LVPTGPSAQRCPGLFVGDGSAHSNCAIALVLVVFSPIGYRERMTDPDELTPADPQDLADALAFALRFQGRKRVHNADEIMAEIVGKTRNK